MIPFVALWLALAAWAQQPGPASSQEPVEPPSEVESPAEPAAPTPASPADTGAPTPAGPPAAPPEAAPDTDGEAAEPEPEPEPRVDVPEPVRVLVPTEATPEPQPTPDPLDVLELPPESPLPLESPTPEAPAPEPAGPRAPAPAAPAPEEIPFYGPIQPPAAPPVAAPSDAEPPIIIVPPQGPLQPVRDGFLDALLPELPMRGLRNGLALLLLALASALVANLARRAREPLLPDGVLPATLRTVETGARVLVVFFVFGVLAAWLPASIAPGLPWVVVAIAVAVGWSARDVLPDLVGWLFVSMEGNVRPGQWLTIGDRRGRVERLGMRATRLRDHLGNVVVVPNRFLVRGTVTADVGWPTIEVRLRLDPEHGPARIRSALREAAELSPWVAPCEPEVYRDGEAWVVRLDLLDGTFADRVEGTLAERVEEILAR